MRARIIALSLLAAAGALTCAAANAQVVRCSDANGKTLYTDSACPAGMHAAGVASLPQACASEDCERRRERERGEAIERVRADKEQLAALTTERHKQELEYRRLDEVRYEAELRSMQAAPAALAEAVYPVYPVYPVAGISSRCGRYCLKSPGYHRVGRHVSHHVHRVTPETPRSAVRIVRDK